MASTVRRSAFENLARGFENNQVFCHQHPYDLYRAWLEAVWAFLNAVHDPDGYLYCTGVGGSLYQPVYLGVRDDVHPGDCTVERQLIKYKPQDQAAA